MAGVIDTNDVRLESNIRRRNNARLGVLPVGALSNLWSCGTPGPSAEMVLDAFHHLDEDGNGVLSKDELELALKEAAMGSFAPWYLSVIQQCIDFGDSNGDGMVDYEEFVKVVFKQEPFMERHARGIKASLVACFFILGSAVFITYDDIPADCPGFTPLNYTDWETGIEYLQSSGEGGQALPSCTTEWTIIDAIYFGAVTVTTVGYGDFGPHSDGMKVFTIFYILFGLGVVGSILADFAGSIIESQQEALLRRLDDDPDDDEQPYGWKIALSFVSIITVVFVGSVFFAVNEDWSVVDAVYWSFVTTTTVGYGDMTLEYSSSRLFSIFYILTSTMVVAAAIGNLGSVSLEMKMEAKKREMLNRKLDMNMIAAMDQDGDGVDAGEFLGAILEQMGLVTSSDYKPILERFYQLDEDGSGKLDKEDLEKLRKSGGMR